MARLDDMVTRMVEPMLALGLKDHPPNKATQNTAAIAQTAQHLELAAELASKSIILLKNKNGILPLKKKRMQPAATTNTNTTMPTTALPAGASPAGATPAGGSYPSMAIFGNPYFRAGRGSGGVGYTLTASRYDAKPCAAPACNVHTAYISEILYNGGVTNMSLGNDPAQAGEHPCPGKCNVSNFNVTRAAAEAAAKELAVVIVYDTTGEGMDRTDLALEAWQELMITTVAAANPNTIVIMRCSGATTMPWLDDVAAVLFQLYPGQAAGFAAGGAILGTINPSGKLPVSFPNSM